LTEGEIRKRLGKVTILFLISTILILMILALPVAAYFSVLKPTIDASEIWFQRSGSLMIALCVILDLIITRVYSTLNLSMADKFFDIAKKNHITARHIYTFIAIILTIISSFIWGYGDLLIKCITKQCY
jgi:hypothetical protein